MNRVTLIGRVGKDPETKALTSGTMVTTATMATTERFKDKNGDKKESTEWHNLVIWGKQAEIFSKYVKKGDRVCVEGKITQRTWDDRDGNKKYRTEIVVSNFEFLMDNKSPDNKNSNDRNTTPPKQNADDDYGF
jgi:single-strand DNA-binding protein